MNVHTLLVYLACATILTGCATDATTTVGKLHLGDLQVVSSNKSLAGDTQRRLQPLLADADGTTSVLQLSEHTKESVVAHTQDGAASKLRLLYTLKFDLVHDGQPVENGEFRLRLTIDNDTNAHNAIRAEKQRFWATARRNCIANLLSKLQLLSLS